MYFCRACALICLSPYTELIGLPVAELRYNTIRATDLQGLSRMIIIFNKKFVSGVETPAIFLVDVDRRSIFMEYIDDAQTLKSFIEERIVTVTENDDRDARANKLARALARILARLHSKNIIHGDLTTSNVLVRKPAQGHDDDVEQGTYAGNDNFSVHAICPRSWDVLVSMSN